MDASYLLEQLAKLSGPVALLVSVVGIIRGMAEIRRWRKEVKEIPYRIAKLDAERVKLGLESNKVPSEIEKLQSEIRNIQASAIANEILSNRTKIGFETIIKCIDNIAENIKEIYSSLLSAYQVFLQPAPSKREVKAAYEGIVKFIEASAHRASFERNVSQLGELLEPLNMTIADTLREAVGEFRYLVSLSRTKDFPAILRGADYDIPDEEITNFKDWIYEVRKSHDNLSTILGRVAAQVEKHARS